MPQDWAPYTSVQDAATVYLRDPELALEQLWSVIEFPGIAAFIMSRGETEEIEGTAIWQKWWPPMGCGSSCGAPMTNSPTTTGN